MSFRVKKLVKIGFIKLIFGLFLSSLFFLPTIKAQFGPGAAICIPFIGQSTPLKEFTINEGQFDFSDTVILSGYKGCLTQSNNDVGDFNDFVFQGWVWNTNLGWVSLGAFDKNPVSYDTSLLNINTPATVSTTNRGITNGSVKYSSMVRVARDATKKITSGELYGYWWGDNTGWIRLNCKQYPGLSGDLNQCSGGATNYGVSILPPQASDIQDINIGGRMVPVQYYRLSGYAWSDNIGWINMAGVKIPIDSPSANPPQVTLILSKSTEPTISDGNSGYEISFKVENSSGANVTKDFWSYVNVSNNDADSSNDVEFCLLFKDDRKLDKTLSSQSGLGLMDNCNDATRFMRYGHDAKKYIHNKLNTNNYRLDLGSPTVSSDDKIVASNKLVSYVSADATDFGIIGFVLKSGTLQKKMTVRSTLELPFAPNFVVKLFKGSESITSVDDCSEKIPSFTGVGFGLNINSDFKVCGRMIGNSTLFSNPLVKLEYTGQDTAVAGDILYDFVRSVKTEGQLVGAVSIPVTTPTVNANRSIINFGPLNTFYSFPFSTAITLNPESTIDPVNLQDKFATLGLKTVLEYDFIDLDGVSKKAISFGPLVSEAFFRVDAVNVFGGFGAKAFTQVSSEGGGAAGAVARAVIRSKLIKSINEVISLSSVNSGCIIKNSLTLKTMIIGNLLKNCKSNSDVELYQITSAVNTKKNISYSNLTEFFSTGNKPKTIILIGFNLIIDQDILGNEIDGESILPSIILLTNKHGQGGYTYVTANVSEVSAMLYVDKSIFSVEDKNMVNNVEANGIPVDYENRDFGKFYNSILFAGRFWSQNCIGCSLNNPPTKGDGSIASDALEAQPYDFNYFRMSSVRLKKEKVGSTEYYVPCANNSITELPGPIRRQHELRSNDMQNRIKEYECWRPPVEITESSTLNNLRSTNESTYRSVNFSSAGSKETPILGKL